MLFHATSGCINITVFSVFNLFYSFLLSPIYINHIPISIPPIVLVVYPVQSPVHSFVNCYQFLLLFFSLVLVLLVSYVLNYHRLRLHFFYLISFMISISLCHFWRLMFSDNKFYYMANVIFTYFILCSHPLLKFLKNVNFTLLIS